MPSIGLREEVRVGKEVVLSSDSLTAKHRVVFEDDGAVGYLYAVEFSGDRYDIVDAMHIYNVGSVVDRDKPSTIQLLWSEDGLKAALLINDYFHAVVDFANHEGCCHTNFPSPGPNWSRPEWSDQAWRAFEGMSASERSENEEGMS